MPLVVRETDLSKGHCYVPTPPQTWSSDVTVNNLGIVRYGDAIVPHCCPGAGCHGGNYIGVHTVSANGRYVQVKGDPISCGDNTDKHSPDVSVDGDG